MKRFVIQCGAFFFRYRNALFPVIFVLVVLCSRPALFLNDPALDFYVTSLGAVLALLGQSLRLAVIGYAYIKRGGKDGKVFAEKLVIRGFYAHCRNPMYTGNLMIGIGLSVMYGSMVSCGLAVPFFLYLYLAITEAEEDYLRRQFGKEYEEYTHRVNRFIPDFSGLKESLKDFQYDWKRAIRKDYGTIFGTFSGILFIVAWKTYLFEAQPRETLIKLLAVFLTLSCLYLAARFSKKTGYLSSPNS